MLLPRDVTDGTKVRLVAAGSRPVFGERVPQRGPPARPARTDRVVRRTFLALGVAAASCARTIPSEPPSPSSAPAPGASASLGTTVAPASALPPIPGRIAEFLTAEGIPYEPEDIEPSLAISRRFLPGLWAYDNTVRSPWGEFRLSDDRVLLGFSTGYYGAPEPRPGEPNQHPNEVVRRWLERHRPDLVTLIDRGLTELVVEESPTRVAFRYRRVRGTGEVSVFPLEVSVRVRTDCRCVSFFQSGRRDFARTVPPQLDDAAARALIHQRYPRVSIDRLDLEEELAESSSFTVYVAELTVAIPGIHDRHPHVLWVFDADTGETIRRLGDPTEANIERPLPAGVSP